MLIFFNLTIMERQKQKVDYVSEIFINRIASLNLDDLNKELKSLYNWLETANSYWYIDELSAKIKYIKNYRREKYFTPTRKGISSGVKKILSA